MSDSTDSQRKVSRKNKIYAYTQKTQPTTVIISNVKPNQKENRQNTLDIGKGYTAPAPSTPSTATSSQRHYPTNANLRTNLFGIHSRTKLTRFRAGAWLQYQAFIECGFLHASFSHNESSSYAVCLVCVCGVSVWLSVGSPNIGAHL